MILLIEMFNVDLFRLHFKMLKFIVRVLLGVLYLYHKNGYNIEFQIIDSKVLLFQSGNSVVVTNELLNK